METQFDMLLDQARDTAGQLRQCMLDERDALEQQNADRLDRSVGGKKRLFGVMEQSWQMLQRMLSEQGHRPDQNGLLAMAGTLGEASRAKAETLIQSLKQCKGLNTLNGSIINLSMRRVNTSLNILFQAQRQTHTYDEGGKSVTRTVSLTHTKA